MPSALSIRGESSLARDFWLQDNELAGTPHEAIEEAIEIVGFGS